MGLKPGYRQTDLGVIPEDWEFRPVEEKGEVRAGKALAARASGAQRPYLRTKNVLDGRIDLSDVLLMPMTEEEFSRYALRAGDVLLNEGQSLELVGRCAVYRNEYSGPCAIQNQLLRFRASPETSGDFAGQLFRRCQRTGVFSRIALQTTSVAHLGTIRLQRLLLAWPSSRDEQVAIADALEDADGLIASLEELLAKKRQIKRGAMEELLTGRRRLSGFTGAWNTRSLGEVFTFNGGLTASRAQLSPKGYCYLHYGDIHGATKTFVDVQAEFSSIPKLDIPLKRVLLSSLLLDGDVVFVDASEDDEGVGRHVVVLNPARIPFIAGLHTIVARPKDQTLCSGFLRYCFQAHPVKEQFRLYSVGTKVSGISRSNVARVRLRVPPVSEQSAIAAILSDMDAEITALETRLAKARLIKQGMMEELLTGRIRLPH